MDINSVKDVLRLYGFHEKDFDEESMWDPVEGRSFPYIWMDEDVSHLKYYFWLDLEDVKQDDYPQHSTNYMYKDLTSEKLIEIINEILTFVREHDDS